MKVACSSCKRAYQIADEKVPSTGARANCPNCGHQILIPPKDKGKTSIGILGGSSSVDFGQTIAYDFRELNQSNTEVSALLKEVSDRDPFLEEGMRYFFKDAGTGEAFSVSKPEVSIGRSGCDINLGDPEVSRRHCRIKIYGDDMVIIDMESTNGTFVRGQRVMTTRIAFGQSFTLGNTTLQTLAERAD